MPFTPLHWGITFLGLVFKRTFYLPALLISSVIMDLEPFYFLFIAKGSPVLHGFFHTYFGATLVALAVSLILVKFRKRMDGLMAFFKVPQKGLTGRQIYFSSLFAAYSHIFLDSFLYKDIRPFWPLEQNLFLGAIRSVEIYLIAGIGVAISLVLYAKILIGKKENEN